MTNLIFYANPWALAIFLAIVLSLAIELPYRFGKSFAGMSEKNRDAFTLAQAGLLTLASFVLGFSFSQAEGRFNHRRALVLSEANAIGTTWLRADALALQDTDRFRKTLTAYTAARLVAYQTPSRVSGGLSDLHRRTIVLSDRDQEEMWGIASRALTARPGSLGLSLLVESLNETIDVSAEQLQALTNHIPTSIVLLTLTLIALGALSLGLRFAADSARPVLLSVLYVAANVVVVNMMIDYDRPQTGLITLNLDPIKRQLQNMQSVECLRGPVPCKGAMTN